MSSENRRTGGRQPSARSASEPERRSGSRQGQHPAGQLAPRSHSSALGILADAALSGSGVGDVAAPQPQSNYLQVPAPATAPEHRQPADSFLATLSLNTRLPSSQCATNSPLVRQPSTRMPSYPANITPTRLVDKAHVRERPCESGTQHSSSISDGAPAFRASDTRGPESRLSETARKEKSSYILDHMSRAGRIEKDNVILDKDRFNYSIYSRDKDAEAAAQATKDDEERATMASGKKRSAVTIEQESTRDLPGERYLRMLEGPEQKSYEEAMLEILDGLELPARSGD